MIGAVPALSASLDANSVVAGFALGLTVLLVLWTGLVGYTILQRLLSD